MQYFFGRHVKIIVMRRFLSKNISSKKGIATAIPFNCVGVGQSGKLRLSQFHAGTRHIKNLVVATCADVRFFWCVCFEGFCVCA